MNKKMIEQELQTVKGLSIARKRSPKDCVFLYLNYFVERVANILNKPTCCYAGFQPLHAEYL